jgi:hypothetical protein
VPYRKRPASTRPLAEALSFIAESDGCSIADAFQQFCEAAEDGAVGCLWADRQKAPRSFTPELRITEPVSPSLEMWKSAKLDPDGHVSFGEEGPAGPINVLWENVERIWKKPPRPSAQIVSLPDGKGKGGRPPKWDKSQFLLEIIRRANLPDGLPDRSVLTGDMKEWCSKQWGSEPADSQLRAWIADVFQAIAKN